MAVYLTWHRAVQMTVLLMDESASVGLDLSFVSYVLLLEPIADTSLEDQVISRAHRMGAKEHILVGMQSAAPVRAPLHTPSP